MLFNSYVFIFALLPITLLVWYSLNHFHQYTISKICLVVSSLIFYAYFHLSYLWIILSSILLNYLLGRILTSNRSDKLRKGAMIVGILANLGVLGYFKYFNFFLQNINLIFKANIDLLPIVLPLGISFFTFQQLSYVIDCYKKEVPNYNFLDYSLFVSFFPQLIAGPIVLHSEIVPQFADASKKKFNPDYFAKGLMAFAFGLAKKVLIADTLGIFVNDGYASLSSLSSLQALITILGYTLQIYFDFSGYCDMATGIASMFNIELPMNFNSPYKSLDILDFWKRWHLTLTRFFTHYIYYPLGGNRKGKARTYLNVFIVFFISGLWHGAGYTFILWGILHGLASIFCRIFKKPMESIPKAIRWVICFAFLNATWVIFRAEKLSDAFLLYRRLFASGSGITATLSTALEKNVVNNLMMNIGLPNNTVLYILGFLLLALLMSVLLKNTNERIRSFKPNFPTFCAVTILLTLSILSLSGVSTFLYFNF